MTNMTTPSPEPVERAGYFGPDAEGDWIVDVLGTDLAFAVPDEDKARRIVAAIEATHLEEVVRLLGQIAHEGQLSADTYGCANCNSHAQIASAALTLFEVRRS
jgi:hypothetical protein